MRCSEVQDHIAPFIEGAVDRDYAREMEQHLDTCSECQEHLARSRQVVFDQPPASALPAGFEASLLDAVIAGSEAPPTRRERIRAWLSGKVEIPKAWIAAYVLGLVLTVAWGAFGSCSPSHTPMPLAVEKPAPAPSPVTGSTGLAPVNYRQLY